MYLQPDIDQYNPGTYRSDRFLKALDPAYVSIDERSFEDLICQTAEFSRFLTYYNSHDMEDGNWQDFFRCIYHFAEDKESGGHVLFSSREEFDAIVADKPYLALLSAFLQMFKLEQDNLNGLTAKHLEYYYSTILRFARKKGVPGVVPLSVELNKNAGSAFIPKGSLFDAGKDEAGKSVKYRSKDDSIILETDVKFISCFFNATDGKTLLSHLGFSDSAVEIDRDKKFGVILSSPLFAVSESSTLFIDTDPALLASVEYTTLSGWKTVRKKAYGTGMTVLLDPLDISGYQPAVHGGEYRTSDPVLRLVLVDNSSFSSSLARFGTARILKEKKAGPSVAENVGAAYKEVFSKLKDSVRNSYSDVLQYMDKLTEDAKVSYLNLLSSSVDGIATPVISSSVQDEDTVIAGIRASFFTPFGLLDTKNGSVLSSLQRSIGAPVSGAVKMVFGVTGVPPGSSLDLFFKLDQTKCNINRQSSSKPTWSFWNGDAWESFKSVDIRKDSTYGLSQSGIIRLKIRDEAVLTHSGAMPGGYVWLCVDIRDFDVFPGIDSVETRVIEVEFDASSEGKPLLGTPLAAGTIQKPVPSIPGVKRVIQKYDGFPGTVPEDDKSFYSRVSERLRHKDRLWSIWDYEHMILESHPSLAAVKCIPSYKDGETAPGHITVMVLPDSGRIPQANPLKPSIGSRESGSIKELIARHASPFVEVSVVNPKYREIRVECSVKLLPDCVDAKVFEEIIRNRLVSYLSPWTGQEDISMVNNHNTSKIEHFIERMEDCVDFIRGFKVYVDNEECSGDIFPQRVDEMLTSVPAEEHTINIVNE
jgi:hypothetical protein